MLQRIVRAFKRCPNVRPIAPKTRLALETLEDRAVPSGTPNSADAARSLTTPTASWFYSGVDANFLADKVTANGARITDIEVDTTSPLRFTATMVKNTGDYGKGWWWYYGQTADSLTAHIEVDHARIIDLEPYTDAATGQRRFAAALVSNTGADAKAWSWYSNVTASFTSTHLSQNNARLVDLEPEDNGRFSFVSVANTGNDARSWWWYYNATPSQVTTYLNQNNARLTNVEREADGQFAVVMERSQGERWSWYYNTSLQDVTDLAGRDGSRVSNIDSYYLSGQKHYIATLLNNSNALTQSIGDDLRAATAFHNGSRVVNVGAVLKPVGSAALADLQGGRQFEPASAVKVLIHVHAMRKVQAGTARLSDVITYFNPPSGDNPNQNPNQRNSTWVASTTTLESALRGMMERSHNGLTWALQQRYGTANINATAAALGLNWVRLGTQPMGSGIAGNFVTANELSRLYELVVTGQAGVTNGSPTRTDDNHLAKLLSLMSDFVPGTIVDLVRSEAARKLGRSSTDPAVTTLTNNFVAQMQSAFKGGSYTLTHPLASYSDYWREIRTEGGYLGMATKVNGQLVRKSYVFSVFLEGGLARKGAAGDAARDAIDDAVFEDAKIEMFRGAIRVAIATW